MLTISSVAVSPVPPQSPTAKAQPVTPVKPSNVVTPENAGVSVAVAPAGEGARAEPVYKPTSFPPVNPAGDAATVSVKNNAAAPERVGEVAASAVAAVAVRQAAQADEADNAQAADAVPPAAAQALAQAQANRRSAKADNAADDARAQAERQRFQGELPPEVRSAVDEALDTQIKELLPNMWEASRAAVDILIGEEAKAAAAARAEVLAPKPEVPNERALDAAENYVRTAGSDAVPLGSQVNKRV